MAMKSLTAEELYNLKESIKQTELGQKIYNDGYKEGLLQSDILFARNYFINGMSYEFVRKSLVHISDEELKKIYSEVTKVH